MARSKKSRGKGDSSTPYDRKQIENADLSTDSIPSLVSEKPVASVPSAPLKTKSPKPKKASVSEVIKDSASEISETPELNKTKKSNTKEVEATPKPNSQKPAAAIKGKGKTSKQQPSPKVDLSPQQTVLNSESNSKPEPTPKSTSTPKSDNTKKSKASKSEAGKNSALTVSSAIPQAIGQKNAAISQVNTPKSEVKLNAGSNKKEKVLKPDSKPNSASVPKTKVPNQELSAKLDERTPGSSKKSKASKSDTTVKAGVTEPKSATKAEVLGKNSVSKTNSSNQQTTAVSDAATPTNISKKRARKGSKNNTSEQTVLEPKKDATNNQPQTESKKNKPSPRAQQSHSEIELSESDSDSDSDSDPNPDPDFVPESEEIGLSDKALDLEMEKLKKELAKRTKVKRNRVINIHKQERKEKNDQLVPTEGRVVYVGHIPHGFYEKEMKLYFKQFGQITRLKLMRNKKTGRSKHYAFIEFSDSEVANIVTETMDNYLLYNRLLKCKILESDKMHAGLFRGHNQKKFKIVPNKKINQINHNKSKSPAQIQSDIAKMNATNAKRNQKFEKLGIDYSYPIS
ncbi:putative RNA-binding protein [Smittium mucronatum]|uniref:Putative RNA-binding protein n=1 Tax=Smittium mucronatum TaxID=133383 RepID=A0A1R0GTH2_9FUNG|nr:putative RNA-binding protein [Smittium mucronatum]